MNVIPLRRFLYLDTQMIDNYLSILDGGLSTGPKTVKETAEKTKEGKAGISVQSVGIGGGIGGKSTTEVQSTVVETSAAKFERLYRSLDSAGITYIEVANDELWDTLQRSSIVEVVGRARLLQWQQLLNVVEQASPLMEVMEQFGQSVDTQTKTMVSGIKQLGAINQGKGTTVILEVLESPAFRFVTTLADQMMQVPSADFEGECTVLASIQRKLKPGEKLTLSSLLPSASALAPLNRAQRRASKSRGKAAAPNPLLEEVVAPACILTTVAIFR